MMNNRIQRWNIMLKSIGIGAELFHELIESNCYYVDKTPFIRTVFKENTSKVMLFTRPGRFGKTLTLSTFYDFLSLNIENPGDVSLQEKWFKDTKIFEDREFCSEYMGKFPVIFISLKAVSGSDFTGAYEQFGSIIFNLYNSFKYLSDSPKLSDTDKKIFNRIATDENFICNVANKYYITDSLSSLLRLLHEHHGIKPVLLIDEYDVPIASAVQNGYCLEMLDIISPFLCNALKTNMDLGRAVLTGCLRATRESIFTGLNNMLVCSILDTGDDDISQGIGFTQEETQEVLTYYGLSDYYEEVRNNYDGYRFGICHMYCPRDVMNFCKDNYKKLSDNRNLIQAGNYWINTSGNDVIEEVMGFIEPKDVDLMQDLLDGKSITAKVRICLCYGDLQNHDINDFWTLMLYTGYLTFDPLSYNPKNDEYSLYIPNEEIRECFRLKIKDFYRSNSVMKASTAELVKALFEGDTERVENNLFTLLGKFVSIRDFATNAPKENYYYGFMNGLLVNGTSFIEEHKSNFESVDGYVDIIIASKNSDTVAILELKHTDKPFGARLIAAQKAVEQITEKGYAAVYMNDPLVRNVYAYGICFHKKVCSVVVKKMK